MTHGPVVREGVVVVVVRGERFLMIRRAAGVIAGGAWCFVGGAIEPGETQAEAAAREFREEVGGRIAPIRRVWEWTRPDGALHLHWWLADLVGGDLWPNPPEVSDLGWMTPGEIAALPCVLESNLLFLSVVGAGLIGSGSLQGPACRAPFSGAITIPR